MDRLIVLDRGRVVEEGDHRSLLAHGGLYARLWAHQSGGFLGEETDDAPAIPPATPAEDAAAVELPARRLEPTHSGHDRLTGSEPGGTLT
jgi:ATP-binding cassette subfamily B multidrug efflux pump